MKTKFNLLVAGLQSLKVVVIPARRKVINGCSFEKEIMKTWVFSHVPLSRLDLAGAAPAESAGAQTNE
jgi:hypothetical protein